MDWKRLLQSVMENRRIYELGCDAKLAALFVSASAAYRGGSRTSRTGDRGATTPPFNQARRGIGWDAMRTLVRISIVTLAPVAVIATLAGYFQVGPVMTTGES